MKRVTVLKMDAQELLLVEDDATTREVLTVLLEADGWTVRAAKSGEAAIAAVRQQELRPRVVLCDQNLPGVHGAALASALRSLAPEATLVAMSASGGGAPREGYDVSLPKPFDPADLRAALATLPASAGSGPGPSSEGDLPVLDTGTFLKLEQQMGGRVRDLYAFALADAGDRLRRMEQHLQNSDAAAFQAEAHQLKGSAGMIGAQRLARLASEAEAQGGGVKSASQDKKVFAMHLACDEIRLMLETLFPM